MRNNCRYGGHVKRFYSVAEHCFILSHAVPYRFAFAALMHDLAEAYIGDIVRPFKRSLPDYKTIEGRIEEVGAGKFRVVYPWPEEVMEADTRILTDERHQLMAHAPIPWGTDCEPLGIKVNGWTPGCRQGPVFAAVSRTEKVGESIAGRVGGSAGSMPIIPKTRTI